MRLFEKKQRKLLEKEERKAVKNLDLYLEENKEGIFREYLNEFEEILVKAYQARSETSLRAYYRYIKPKILAVDAQTQ